jgi:hypothetical protein
VADSSPASAADSASATPCVLTAGVWSCGAQSGTYPDCVASGGCGLDAAASCLQCPKGTATICGCFCSAAAASCTQSCAPSSIPCSQ